MIILAEELWICLNLILGTFRQLSLVIEVSQLKLMAFFIALTFLIWCLQYWNLVCKEQIHTSEKRWHYLCLLRSESHLTFMSSSHLELFPRKTNEGKSPWNVTLWGCAELICMLKWLDLDCIPYCTSYGFMMPQNAHRVDWETYREMRMEDRRRWASYSIWVILNNADHIGIHETNLINKCLWSYALMLFKGENVFKCVLVI